MRNGALAAVVILLGSTVPSLRATVPPAKEYRIAGVVVSARDGAPVPYCRLTAYGIAPAGSVVAGAATPASERAAGQPAVSGRIDADGRMGVGPTGQRAGPGGNRALEATADGSGRFSIAVPRAGGWRLSATARGFRPQNYDEHEGFYSEIVLSEGAPSFVATFRLTPDSELSGLIFDDSGEPVGSAQVSAELVPAAIPGNFARPRTVGTVQTDDRGRYEIGGLAPGEYRLRVQAQPWYSSSGRGGVQLRVNGAIQTNSVSSPDPSLDFVYPVTWFPGVDDESAAELIKVAPGEERQADFRLTAVPSVHLKVPRAEVAPNAFNDQRGRPQQQRMVSITRVGGSPGPGMQQMMPTASSGNEWDFGGLAPGTYEVRIPGEDGRSNEVRRIEVKPGSPADLTMEGAKSLIPVQVELDGIPNSRAATLDFVDTETGERISSVPNMRGRGGFQRDDQGGDDSAAEEVESASRTVMLEAHSYEIYLTGGAASYLTGIEAAGAKVAGRLITIAGPATIKLHLANSRAQLDGVARIGGEPAAGAMVLLVPATFGSAGALTTIGRAETNTDGSFRMSAVTPGPYILVAIDHGWNVDWRNPAPLGQYLLHGMPVNLQAKDKSHQELVAVPAN